MNKRLLILELEDENDLYKDFQMKNKDGLFDLNDLLKNFNYHIINPDNKSRGQRQLEAIQSFIGNGEFTLRMRDRFREG